MTMANITKHPEYKNILRLSKYIEGNILDYNFRIHDLDFFKKALKLYPEILNKIYICKGRCLYYCTIFDAFGYPVGSENHLDIIFKYNVNFRIIECEINSYIEISQQLDSYTNILFRYYFAARYKRILVSYWLCRRIRQIKHRYIVALLLKSRIRMFNIIDELIDFLKD